MESLTPELQTLVTQIASENSITNYLVEVNNSVSNDGDGYIGILNGLSIIDKESDKNLNLVVKKAPTNENLRKQFPTRSCFLREISMYSEVFPELLEFQEEYNIPNPFKSITKLHGYISDELKETLLLENLKEHGYILCQRQEPLDSHHLSLGVTEYAKLHAVSHAIKRLKPEKFEKIKTLIGANMMMEFDLKGENQNDSGAQMQDLLFTPTLEALEKKPKLVQAVSNFRDNAFEFMQKEDPEAERHNVVCHGDCWSANLLFKYEDQKIPQRPTKLCIIDWQMALLGSPIHDLSYFLYIGAGKNDLDNYMTYLRLYHKVLSETLTAFGLDPEDVYSFEFFEKEWKEKSKMGFFMALLMMQQTLSVGKIHDFEAIAKEGKSIFDLSIRKVEVTELFEQRMGDLVEFLVEHNFI